MDVGAGADIDAFGGVAVETVYRKVDVSTTTRSLATKLKWSGFPALDIWILDHIHYTKNVSQHLRMC